MRVKSLALPLGGGGVGVWVGCWSLVDAAGQENGEALPAAASITAQALGRHVQYLASDALEGREAGTRGGQAAGQYVRQQLAAIPIRAGGPGGGYDQPFGSRYRNILGLLEGMDPQLKHQVVLVCAHYDHVGRGTEENSQGPVGEIHNGADDNASGVAMLLELAQALANLPQRPARSILLAFWDAEEKEMLGSRHWIAQPTLPLGTVTAAINLDMVGRLHRNRLTLYGSRTGYGLRRLVSEQNRYTGLEFDFSRELEDDGDHHPFFSSGIPVLFLHTGIHDDFHSPRDDAEFIDTEGMARIAELSLHLVRDLAQRPHVPAFRQAANAEAEIFRRQGQREARAASSPMLQKPVIPAAHSEGKPPRLGISFREDEAEAGSVVLTGVVPGSPAEEAGLRPGDRIYQVDGSDFNGTHSFLRSVKWSGSPLTLLIERDGRLSTTMLPFPGANAAQQRAIVIPADHQLKAIKKGTADIAPVRQELISVVPSTSRS
ncbi:MAG: M20/M25/M40 family metallo-hydrolase [Pirellulaceae bacterium]